MNVIAGVRNNPEAVDRVRRRVESTLEGNLRRRLFPKLDGSEL